MALFTGDFDYIFRPCGPVLFLRLHVECFLRRIRRFPSRAAGRFLVFFPCDVSPRARSRLETAARTTRTLVLHFRREVRKEVTKRGPFSSWGSAAFSSPEALRSFLALFGRVSAAPDRVKLPPSPLWETLPWLDGTHLHVFLVVPFDLDWGDAAFFFCLTHAQVPPGFPIENPFFLFIQCSRSISFYSGSGIFFPVFLVGSGGGPLEGRMSWFRSGRPAPFRFVVP